MLNLILIAAASLSVFLVVAGVLLTVFSPRTAVLGRLDFPVEVLDCILGVLFLEFQFVEFAV